MKVFYFTVLILYLSSQFTSCTVEDEFVDPLDMLNYDRATKSMKRPKTVSSESEPIQNDRCTAFLSRFVNILLIHTGLSNLNYKINEDDNEKLKSDVSVTINVQDLELLKNMVNTKDIDYVEIDRILNGMFIPLKNSLPKFDETYSSIYTYYDQVKEVLYWISVGVISICLLYIIVLRIHHVFSITFVIFIIFGLAFASTWYTMYMKAEINRSVYLEHMPANCYEKTGNWIIFSWFDRRNRLDECKKYKEAIHLDPKYSIATTEVLAEMFSKIMLKPLETLGESIYIFNKSVLKDFPVWAQMFLVPIIVIIIIKTMLLSCALLVGRQLSMKSFFGYGGTSIGSGPTNNGSNNSTHPMIPAQSTVPQIPEVPKVNFNINLFHPSSSIDYGNRIKDSSHPFDNKLKINSNKQNNLISMLKNEVNDSVDNKESTDLIAKIPRHRTMSF